MREREAELRKQQEEERRIREAVTASMAEGRPWESPSRQAAPAARGGGEAGSAAAEAEAEKEEERLQLRKKIEERVRVETERLFQLEMSKMEQEEQDAAARIQAIHRGRKSRRSNNLTAQRELVSRSRAAVVVQRRARGRAGRRKAERRREGRDGWTDTLDGSLLARLGVHGGRAGRLPRHPGGRSARQFCSTVGLPDR